MSHDATEVVTDPGAGARTIREFQLEVIDGEDRDRSHRAVAERTVIGTHESADFRLTDRSLSRFHCEIMVRGAEAVVRDLDSKNGARVDDVPVYRAPLRDGAVLQLGRTRLRFTLGADQVPLRTSARDHFGLLRGRSSVMREVFALLESAAPGESTVLLQGETGVGKDLAARSIHAESPRRRGPFVVVDCSAIPASLLESELFGHERGAFTGADQARAGAFESAAGGTIFLDEIGELGLELQPKLLRVLENREIRRVGASRTLPVNVRVICATNRRLHAQVNSKQFRADLYYRIAVIQVVLPPLREHPEDIPELVDALLTGMRVPEADAAFLRSASFLSELRQHTWPGNVRELRNYVERCLLLQGQAPLMALGEEDPGLRPGETLKQARDRWLRVLERRYLEDLLRQKNRDILVAAEAAGIGRAYLYRLMARHRIR